MESLVGRSQDMFVMQERRRRRRRLLLLCFAAVAVAAMLIVILVNLYINHAYRSYQVEHSITVKNNSELQYQSYDGGVLRYSRDGVAAVDRSGKELWNGSYNMDRPKADICDTSVVVADIGGKDLYVYTDKKQGTDMTMDYKILQACVSGQGVVAVMLEDTASNVIQVYDPFQSKLLVEIPTNVEKGYPVAMDISPDGTGMAVSYVCVTSGVVQSRVAFYNYTDVGENTNCLVGAQEYQDRVVSEIQYQNDSQVCLFHEKGYSIWSNLKKPEETVSKEFKKEIVSSFYTEDYVGVVLAESGGEQCRLRLYNSKGREIMSRKIPADYTHIAMSGKEILVNTTGKCSIYRVNGVRKWNCSTKATIRYFLPSEGMNRYFLVTDRGIESIKLH